MVVVSLGLWVRLKALAVASTRAMALVEASARVTALVVVSRPWLGCLLLVAAVVESWVV